MKNRPLTAPVEVPRAIKKEYSVLSWYSRALSELDSMNSVRAQFLSKLIREELEAVISNPVRDCDSATPPSPITQISSESDEIPALQVLSEPWYNKLLIPHSIAEVLLDLRVRDGLIGIITAVILALVLM